jgi:hypothetical protein
MRPPARRGHSGLRPGGNVELKSLRIKGFELGIVGLSRCNPQPATRNAQPATRNAQRATRNAQRVTRNAQPATRNPQRVTRNPQPVTRNP